LFGKYLQPHWRVSRARSAEATRHVDTSPRDKEEMGAAWLAASSEGGGRESLPSRADVEEGGEINLIRNKKNTASN
jgi:hypothetical protein